MRPPWIPSNQWFVANDFDMDEENVEKKSPRRNQNHAKEKQIFHHKLCIVFPNTTCCVRCCCHGVYYSLFFFLSFDKVFFRLRSSSKNFFFSRRRSITRKSACMQYIIKKFRSFTMNPLQSSSKIGYNYWIYGHHLTVHHLVIYMTFLRKKTKIRNKWASFVINKPKCSKQK